MAYLVFCTPFKTLIDIYASTIYPHNVYCPHCTHHYRPQIVRKIREYPNGNVNKPLPFFDLPHHFILYSKNKRLICQLERLGFKIPVPPKL
jgi:hypothetical protein